MIFLAGVAVFSSGVAQIIVSLTRQWAENRGAPNRVLNILQIVMGTILLVLLIWYLVVEEPYLNSFPAQVIAANGGDKVVFHSSGWIRLLISWKVATFILSLAVIALGIKGFFHNHTWRNRS